MNRVYEIELRDRGGAPVAQLGEVLADSRHQAVSKARLGYWLTGRSRGGAARLERWGRRLVAEPVPDRLTVL